MIIFDKSVMKAGKILELSVKKAKLNYINYSRAIAIMFIVAGHTMVWGKLGHSIFKANAYFLKGGTLLFIFIAGFLFQYLAYKFDYKKFLINKFKNVIMPYWITMLPIVLYFSLTCSDTTKFLYAYSPHIRFFNTMLWGQIINGALWFIPMIVIFYLVSPILLKLKKYPILWYTILICLLYTTLVTVRPGYAIVAMKNVGVSLLHWNLNIILMYFQRFVYFLPVYMLGMSICDLLEKYYSLILLNINKIIIISFSCWIYFYFLCTKILHISQGASNVGRVALTFFVLSLFIKFEAYIKKNKVLDKILNLIADYSFGIFFIHMYIFYLLTKHIPYSYSRAGYERLLYHNTLKSMLLAVAYFLITFLGSILVLFVIKKILKKLGVKNTRMFIGVGDTAKSK